MTLASSTQAEQVLQSVATGAFVFLFVMGALQILAGFALRRFLAAMAGLGMGAVAGLWCAVQATASHGATPDGGAMLAGACIGGLAGAMLLGGIEVLGTFVLAGGGAVTAVTLVASLQDSPIRVSDMGPLVLACVVGGVVGLCAKRPVLIVAQALQGTYAGWMALTGLQAPAAYRFQLLTFDGACPLSPTDLMVMAGVMVVGAIIQFSMTSPNLQHMPLATATVET